MENETITRTQARQILGVSRQRVHQLVQSGMVLTRANVEEFAGRDKYVGGKRGRKFSAETRAKMSRSRRDMLAKEREREGKADDC